MSSMSSFEIDSRVDALFQSVNLGVTDCTGLMRHILDCCGALRVRMRADRTVSQPLKNVFKSAVVSFLDHIVDKDTFDTNSATKFLMESFPDERKRRDGRQWLPLHWASALEACSFEDFSAIAKERPLMARVEHSRVPGTGSLVSTSSILQAAGGASDSTKEKEISDVGLLPIHFMAANKYPIMANVKTLIDIFPESTQVMDGRGWLPIHWCAFNGSDTDVFNMIFESYPSAIYRHTMKGQLPFQLSLNNRRLEMIEAVYLENEDAIEAIDYKGNSAAHDAARSLNPEGLNRLLTLKPDIAMTHNLKGDLPIHRLFQNLPKLQRIQWRQLETAKILIASDPEIVSVKDGHGNLPLHLATYYNSSFELIELLYSAYPSGSLVKDAEGNLPIHYVTVMDKEGDRSRDIHKLLMQGSPPLLRVGIKSSFANLTI